MNRKFYGVQKLHEISHKPAAEQLLHKCVLHMPAAAAAAHVVKLPPLAAETPASLSVHELVAGLEVQKLHETSHKPAAEPQLLHKCVLQMPAATAAAQFVKTPPVAAETKASLSVHDLPGVHAAAGVAGLICVSPQ